MHLKNQKGQGLMLAVLCVGVIMAGMVLFGGKRSEDVSKNISKLDINQSAYEALATVGKRVQNIYAGDAGCDPAQLDARLSALAALPTLASGLGYNYSGNTTSGTGVLTYAPAQPSHSGSSAAEVAARANRCTGGTGCRQFAVPIDSYVYIVTAGAVSRDLPDSGRLTTDCPRDVSVRLSLAVNGSIYWQNVTLTNLCTLASCRCTTGSLGTCASTDSGFANWSVTSTSALSTLACTGIYSGMTARSYGSLTSTPSTTTVQTNDLRWARKFLETGGGSAGETSFLYPYISSSPPSGNGTCVPSLSAGQCRGNNCIPAFDLNRDGTNNEVDLAILEHYMRGYLTSLPVNELP